MANVDKLRIVASVASVSVGRAMDTISNYVLLGYISRGTVACCWRACVLLAQTVVARILCWFRTGSARAKMYSRSVNTIN